MPRSGRERDGVDRQHFAFHLQHIAGAHGPAAIAISPPAPISPPAIGMPLLTSSDMVMAAVCQPLAARPWKKLACAAASSSVEGLGIKAGGETLDLVRRHGGSR